MYSPCAVERRAFLVGAKTTQQLSLRLVAARAVHGGNDMDLKHSGEKGRLGRLSDHAGRSASER